MNNSKPTSVEIAPLLKQVREGNSLALNELLERHREWIRGVVELRLDPSLRRRIDPSDVVQDVQMEVARRMPDYLERNPMPFHLWLRQTTYDNLIDLRRKHLNAACRSVQREVRLAADSSVQLVNELFGEDVSPDRNLVEKELVDRLHTALDQLSEGDRDVVLLRIFEGLDNQDVSRVLGIHPSTGSKRFGRALFQLRAILLQYDSQERTS